jgi:hypothetical protein
MVSQARRGLDGWEQEHVVDEGVEGGAVEGLDTVGAREADAFVEGDSGRVGGVDVEDERGAMLGAGVEFGCSHELRGDAEAAVTGVDIEGHDVAGAAIGCGFDVEDDEAGQDGISGGLEVSDENSGVWGFRVAAHRGAREAKGARKAGDVQGVHGGEVGWRIGAESEVGGRHVGGRDSTMNYDRNDEGTQAA